MRPLLIAMALAIVASGPAAESRERVESVPTSPAGLRVKIDTGVLEGALLRDGDPVLAFKGIPYADSPAGAWRWKPPRSAPAWRDVRAAREFGPICPQTDRDLETSGG